MKTSNSWILQVKNWHDWKKYYGLPNEVKTYDIGENVKENENLISYMVCFEVTMKWGKLGNTQFKLMNKDDLFEAFSFKCRLEAKDIKAAEKFYATSAASHTASHVPNAVLNANNAGRTAIAAPIE